MINKSVSQQAVANRYYAQSKYYKLQDVLYCLWAVCELRRQASQLAVPVTVLAVKMVLERLMEVTETEEVKDEEDKRRGLLTSSQRVSVSLLDLTYTSLSQNPR